MVNRTLENILIILTVVEAPIGLAKPPLCVNFSYQRAAPLCGFLSCRLRIQQPIFGTGSLQVSAEELKKVCAYTGGWISLIYLILLGIKQGISIGRSSVVDELVEKVLYSVYDEGIKGFLVRLSVMNSFTMRQAQFVTEEPCAAEYLKKLRRENAFVIFDDTLGTYKIHNVLLDFLREKQENNDERRLLYKRLGEWHLERKEYVTAYGNLFRAGETERILASLESDFTITGDTTEFEGVFDLFEHIPRKLLFQYPIAYLQYLGILIRSGRPGSARDGAARLDEFQSVYESMDHIPSGKRNRILGEINVIRVFSVFNDIRRMRLCTNEAAKYLAGGQTRLVKQNGEFTFGSPHFLYSYYREPGKLEETAELIVSEFPAFIAIDNSCGTGCDSLALAEYALETGDFKGAELNAFKAIHKAERKGQTCIALCANMTLIRMYICQGKIGEALELLHRTREEVIKKNNAISNTTVELIEGYVYGCLGRLDKIPEWLRTGDMSPAHFMYEGLAFNYIVYGKAVLLSKNYIRLETLIEEFKQYFDLFRNQLGFLHNRIFDAAAKYNLYGMEAGCAALREAFDEARADRIILPFAEYAPAIIDIVRHLVRCDSKDTYIRDVLSACEGYMDNLKWAPQSMPFLSARELEILTLAAEGLKREEIAEKLHVSGSTVHSHLHNIYLKLEVNGRTGAIKKAQQMKIL